VTGTFTMAMTVSVNLTVAGADFVTVADTDNRYLNNLNIFNEHYIFLSSNNNNDDCNNNSCLIKLDF
jgi:hypothetical protein